MKFLKRSWYNICGACDNITSRAQTNAKPWLIGLAGGACTGVLMGIGAAKLDQAFEDNIDDIQEERIEWLNDNAEYGKHHAILRMPSSCGLGDKWYFAAKESRNDYTLYAGEGRTLVAQDQDAAEEFGEKFDKCFQGIAFDDDRAQKLRVGYDRMISEPLSDVNTANGEQYYFRDLALNGTGFDVSFQRLLDIDSYKGVLLAWQDAVETFHDGDASQPTDNFNEIKTFSHAYQNPGFKWSIIGDFLLICIVSGTLASGFSKPLSQSYHKRSQIRDKKRELLDRDNTPF